MRTVAVTDAQEYQHAGADFTDGIRVHHHLGLENSLQDDSHFGRSFLYLEPMAGGCDHVGKRQSVAQLKRVGQENAGPAKMPGPLK